MINGNLSTVIFVQSIIEGSAITVIDVLALVVFNLFQIFMFFLQHFRPKSFGEFRIEFLRYDISQDFYRFIMLYLFSISLIFSLLFGSTTMKYCCVFPTLMSAAIIVFNQRKSPYL